MKKANSKKVLLVGWDAADWKIIHKLMDQGRLPTVKRLVENGTMGNMATLFPALSPMLWTSVATGKRPYKHGIYGFTEPGADGLSVQPMTIMSRKCKAVWNILNQHDKKSLVVGWWPSHPAEPIDGVMVSDFYNTMPRKPGDPFKLMKNTVSPSSLEPALEKMRVHPSMLEPKHVLPFVPRAAEIDQETDNRLSSLMRIICECTTVHRAAAGLLQTQEWDFAAVYYDAIDHFSHAFMRYHPPHRPHINKRDYELFNNVVTQGYIYHDILLRELLKIAGDDVTVILMSDHGFHPDHLRPKSIPLEPAGPAVEHRDLGIFVACGEGIKKDHVVNGASLLDVAPTILTLYGLPYGEDMDGAPLTDIFEDDVEVSPIPSWEHIDGNDGRHSADAVVDAASSKETLEQLIALGYIERPDSNATVAVSLCQAELDYNLARAFMDGNQYGEAIPLLVNLYNDFPLEFRFGLQLSNCLNAMGRLAELEILVADLNHRWRNAQTAAKEKIREFAKVYKERRAQFKELKSIDKENEAAGRDVPQLAKLNAHGKPKLFTHDENRAIRKIRSVAKGNSQLLDFMSAMIAASKGEFERAIEIINDPSFETSKNPMFHVQRGNFYLELKQFEQAERSYVKVIEIDELNAPAILGLCRVHLGIGKHRKALDFAKQAIGLKYQFPLAHYYLGVAKSLDGDTDEAIASFQTALGQNPNFAEAHRKLAEIYSTERPDKNLAQRHRDEADELSVATDEYQQNIESIELKPVDSVEFEKFLPKISEQNSSEFVRCLAQPKPLPSGLAGGSLEVNEQPIVIVSGLPRSGTSMMMQMLVAGGMTAYTDQVRGPDENNPKGYFESTEVKKLAYLNNWVGDCAGKALKVVAPMAVYLPQHLNYQFIFMDRHVDEVVVSQERMLERLERTGGNLTPDKLADMFLKQVAGFRNITRFHKIPVLNVPYASAVQDPLTTANKVSDFLQLNFELDLKAMVAAVDPALYREKKKP